MRRKTTRILSLVSLVAGFGAGLVILNLVLPSRPSENADGDAKARKEDSRDVWRAALGSVPRFVDVTQAADIKFLHFNGLTGKFHYPELMGAGVALFDYNGDGLLDVYFVNGNYLLEKPSPEITNRLYRNNGDWTFTDVTVKAGVGDAGYGQGCCVGDYDNDGDSDLYVSNYGPNVLYSNNGDGTFTNVTQAAGLGDPNWGQTCSFLDFNKDGLLDLYVQNYLVYSLQLNFEAFIYIGDRKVLDYPNPKSFRGAPDHLYRNNGDGTFTDVTRTTGFDRSNGRGMGCACLDLDDDGDTDIFVTNDTQDNHFFRNRGNGTFEEVGLAVGVAFSGTGTAEASMGVDVGDFDGDGRFDLAVPCVWQQVFTLYRNEGGYLTDVSWETGLVQATSKFTGFSPNFLDYDNDGDQDLFFANGMVRMDKLVSEGTPYEQRYGHSDSLLANDGKGHYTEVSHWAGSHFNRKLISRGSATGDLDNDGRIDLVISNLAGRPAVLRNETAAGNWVTVELIPRVGNNRDALGTSIWVEAGGRRQRAAVHGGVTYVSQIDRRPHFGLANAEKVDRLEVLWPDGQRQEHRNLPVNRFLTIRQGVDEVK